MVDREGKKLKEEKRNSVVKGDEGVGADITGLYDYFLNLLERLKEKNYYRDFFELKEPEASAMFGNIEAQFKELFTKIEKIIEDFLENEVKKLNSEEDLKKNKTVLSQYKSTVEKIFKDQSRSINEMKDKWEKNLMTPEELTQFIKLSETKLNELRKKTSELIDPLNNPELDAFKKNLKDTLHESNEKIVSACSNLLNAFKKSIEEKSMPSKLPLSEIKFPDMQTKKLPSNSKNGLTVPKPIISPEIREKLKKFSFTRHFNSETVTGRANVARLTIFGAILGYLYWRRKRSKAQQ